MALIDRDAFKIQTLEWHCAECNDYNGVLCRSCTVQDILDEMDDFETVDAVPVVRGKWIRDKGGDGNLNHCIIHCRSSSGIQIVVEKKL